MDVEGKCADIGTLQWPRPSELHHPILRSVLRNGTYRSVQEAEAQVQKGILAFANENSFVRDQFFKNLDQFAKRAIAKDHQEKPVGSKASVPDDYPAHVNATLYEVLRDHSSCTCTILDPTHGNSARVQRHPGRLKLRADMVKENGGIAFEMLLSASPRADDYWQDLQVTVVMYETQGVCPGILILTRHRKAKIWQKDCEIR